MQIKDPGFFSRGACILPYSPHITPDSLLQELQQAWGPRGSEVYKTALIGAERVLFGSDYPHIVGDMAGMLANVHTLPSDAVDAIRGANAERIFDL